MADKSTSDRRAYDAPSAVIEPWKTEARVVELQTAVFEVARLESRPPGGAQTFERYVIEAPDWCNVIAVTDDDRAVMIRQYRVGRDEITLEIPGGMVDPGETPAAAALRELREETGFVAGELVALGSIAPNPAILNNRCFSFLARDLSRGERALDHGEDISVELMPLSQARAAASSGAVTHSLVVVAFHFFDAYEAARGRGGKNDDPIA